MVEDHELMQRALEQMLAYEDDLDLVGVAESQDEALRRIEASHPDVILLDLHLAQGDGIEVCRSVVQEHPEMKCLVLTSDASEETLFDALDAGAVGFMFKDAKVDELIEAVRKVSRGEPILAPAATQRLLVRLRRRTMTASTPLDRLTDREYSLLALVAEGLTNKEIAGRLFVAEQTVKNQLSLLFRKLGVERRAQAAVLGARLRRDQ